MLVVLSLFFVARISAMNVPQGSLLSDAENQLRERFSKGDTGQQRMPSDASAARSSDRIDQLALPDELRGRMPFTKEKFLVKENPHLVGWEREVRKFLRRLSPEHAHRVSAVMVYEWVTGIPVAEIRLMPTPPGRQTWRSDLRKINIVLEYYFGRPYMTYIMGRKVPKAYRVPAGTYITRRRPMTLTLYAEYADGVLSP
jgi:hypothetical protein